MSTARAAQRAWARTPVEHRERVLLRYHDLVLDRQAELLDLVQLESGKTRRQAFEEVADCRAGLAPLRADRQGLPADPPPARALPGAHPDAGAAPPQGRRRHRLALELPPDPRRLGRDPGTAGGQRRRAPARPPGVADRAPGRRPAGRGRAAGGALPGRPRRRPHGRTGGRRPVRLRLLHRARPPWAGTSRPRRARRLVGASLELGGKNTMYVAADADLGRAVDGCRAGLLRLRRAAVHLRKSGSSSTPAVADEFAPRFVEAVKAMRLGTELAFGRRHGLAGVRGAERAGARHTSRTPWPRVPRVLTGGRARPDVGPVRRTSQPCSSGVTSAMACRDEETFGPVVSHLPRRLRRRGRPAGQRHRVRPQRLGVDPRRPPRAPHRRPDPAPAPSTSTRATPPRGGASPRRWAG